MKRDGALATELPRCQKVPPHQCPNSFQDLDLLPENIWLDYQHQVRQTMHLEMNPSRPRQWRRFQGQVAHTHVASMDVVTVGCVRRRDLTVRPWHMLLPAFWRWLSGNGRQPQRLFIDFWRWLSSPLDTLWYKMPKILLRILLTGFLAGQIDALKPEVSEACLVHGWPLELLHPMAHRLCKFLGLGPTQPLLLESEVHCMQIPCFLDCFGTSHAWKGEQDTWNTNTWIMDKLPLQAIDIVYSLLMFTHPKDHSRHQNFWRQKLGYRTVW